MFNLILVNNNILYPVILCAVVLVVILGVFIGIYLYKKKKTPSISSEAIESIKTSLGGTNNIVKVEVEQSRLKIEVTDLDLCDLEQLKTLSEKGVFITGNTIKVLFKEDAKTIKNELEKG